MRGRGISLHGQPSVTTSLASEAEDAAEPLGAGTSGPSQMEGQPGQAGQWSQGLTTAGGRAQPGR